MTQKKLFGTDGVRGMANVYPLTSEAVTVLGRAIALYFKRRSGHKNCAASIGMDPRISSSMLADAVTAGIRSAGIDATMLGVVPTPLVSMHVVENKHDFGVVISASHNPYHDNGVKIFNEKGTKLNDEEELEIETIYFNENGASRIDGNKSEKIPRDFEAVGRYAQKIKKLLWRVY